MTHTPSLAAPRQVLLRLPEDVATQLARAVPPGRRNQFLVDLVAKALADRRAERSSRLEQSAQRMNELEAQHPELARDTEEWAQARLTGEADAQEDGFDPVLFERSWAEAEARRLDPK